MSPTRFLLLRLSIVVGIVLGLASRALAHDFWIEPSDPSPAVGEAVTLRLRVGERFQGDPVPRNDAKIEKFFVVGPEGESLVRGRDGSDPAGALRARSAGLHVVGFRSRASFVELAASKFEAYLAEEGLDSIVAARKAKGMSDQPGREVYSRCAKSLLRVNDGQPLGAAPLTGFDRVLGLRLELIPLQDPATRPSGSPLEVELRLDGMPLVGALVVAFRREEPAAKLSVRTDETGHVALPLTGPGTWLVKSVHMLPAPADSKADWESLWASITFEVPMSPAAAAPADAPAGK